MRVLRFHEEDRVWYLYSPTDADSHYEHGVANRYFDDGGGKFWLEVPVTARDGGSLLRNQYLEAVQELSSYISSNVTVPCQSDQGPTNECSFDHLCMGPCNSNQVLPIFALLYRNKTHFRNHPNFRLTYPTMQLYNDQYYVGEHFSGVKVNWRTNRIDSIKLIVLHFRSDKGDSTHADRLHQWELKVLELAKRFGNPRINMSATSNGIISAEVRRNGLTCTPYFALSILVVLVFAVSTSINRNPVLSKPFEAAVGVIGPLLAIGMSYGLLTALGFPFNSIVTMMPFLVLGIGVDDAFIMLHAWRNCGSGDKADGGRKVVDVPRRLGAAMQDAGPSITITSLTNWLSFTIGAFSSTPAIRLFCIYTATGIFIDFLMQITFFVGFMAVGGNREARNENGNAIYGVPIKSNKVGPTRKEVLASAAYLEAVPSTAVCRRQRTRHRRQTIATFSVENYCRVVASLPMKALILLLLLFYWAIAGYGCTQVRIEMETSQLVLYDSPLNGVAWSYKEYLWRQGSLLYVFVDNPPDFADPQSTRDMLNMVREFENLPYSMGRNSTSFWLRKYMEYLLYNSAQDQFYSRLPRWLADEQSGVRWRDFLRLDTETGGGRTSLRRFFFATGFAMGDHVSWSTRVRLQKIWRRMADNYRQFNVTVFQTYSFYVDQLESIGGTTTGTVLVALVVMALICLSLIPNPVSVLTASAAMLSVNIGVFGYLALWKVNLDPIAMCTILMSIGFSVDFTAHISYHYYRESASDTPEAHKRMARALRGIGRPMLQAGVSTLLGIAPLFLVPSYMVTVFLKTVFLVIFFGLLHGIVILPSLLPFSFGCCASGEKDHLNVVGRLSTASKTSRSSSGYSSDVSSPVPSSLVGRRSLSRVRSLQPTIIENTTRLRRRNSL